MTPTGPSVPPWRSGSIGWVLLNIGIGLALGLGLFIVAAILMGAGHFDTASANRIVQSARNAVTITPEAQRLIIGMFGAVMISFAAGLTSWLLFVYLRVANGVRAAILIVVPVLAVIASYAMMASVLPKLPGY